MKLAVSNLAWEPSEDVAVADALSRLGVKYIELAPTKYWPDLSKVPTAEAAKTRRFWEGHGFQIVALQSILFNQPGLKLFESDAVRAQMLEYLKRVFELSAALGAKILVFGSPKNRRRGELSPEAAQEIAVRFFRQAGEAAAAAGVILCIEPNAPQYACDFITRAHEGRELVDQVNSPGFDLHLDAACMAMAGDWPEEAASLNPRHFHISAPQLGAVPSADVPYTSFARALSRIPYEHFVSIEMRPEPTGNLERTLEAVRFSQSTFA